MDKIKPMLCQDAKEAFDSPDYIWETKYDGARIIARVNFDDEPTRLFGRSGAEKTRLFPELRIETKTPCILDGEVISGDSFNNIQHRINRQNGIGLASKSFPAVFKVFDIIQVELKDGQQFSLATAPLIQRKAALAEILVPTETVQLAEHTEKGVELFNKIEQAGGEGVIGKRKKGIYLENKREWLKVKTWRFGTFQVVGYTQGTGWRTSTFGALVLADEKGTHVGEVGTGFNADDIRSLCAMFSPAPCPFPREPEPATWIKPFVVKIRYLEFTVDGKLRFPSFRGVI